MMAFRIDVCDRDYTCFQQSRLQTFDTISSQHQFCIMAASKTRTVILTGGVAAITAMGAWYGATLKSDREVRQVCI